MMNILILGSGGREHALALKIKESKKCSRLFVAPGNPGTAVFAENIPFKTDNFEALKETLMAQNIKMVVVGPEQALVDGIHDFIANDSDLKHIICIGPKKAGAQLEASKDFSKKFMQKYAIPTARYQCFDAAHFAEGKAFLQNLSVPYVLKADGLAAGKGVVICSDLKEAERELEEMLCNQKFGAASARVVIEEYLHGIELSVFVITDGKDYKILPVAKDYKRIGIGDTGLNTGGMGSVSPVTFADEAFMKKVEDRIIRPTIEGLQKETISYQGFIFIGLMNVKGDPFVIEYNVRLGDPETESVLPRITSDMVELFEAVGKGNLANHQLTIDPRTAACVILSSAGYPEHYETGKEIKIDPQTAEDIFIFHAGTRYDNNDRLLTAGGRVLAICAMADNLENALEKVYSGLANIHYPGKYFRSDIGKDLLCK